MSYLQRKRKKLLFFYSIQRGCINETVRIFRFAYVAFVKEIIQLPGIWKPGNDNVMRDDECSIQNSFNFVCFQYKHVCTCKT